VLFLFATARYFVGWERQLLSRQIFSLVVKTTYPAITTHGHRGVSAFSSRDGAILCGLGTPTFKSACLEKSSHGYHRDHKEEILGNGLGTPWERQLLSWHALKKSSHGYHRGHKEEMCFRNSTHGLCVLCVLCVLCAKPSFTFLNLRN